MRLGLFALLVVVGLAAATQASIIGDLTGVHYQNDGGTGEDAGEVCEPTGPSVSPGSGEEGSLLPIDDEVDMWAMWIGRGGVGREVILHVHGDNNLGPLAVLVSHQIRYEVFTPGCERMVLFGVANECTSDSRFLVEEEGTYTIKVSLRINDPLRPVIEFADETYHDLTEGTPAPRSRHCSPYCMFDYIVMPRYA